MSLAFSACSAVVAAACAWPASALMADARAQVAADDPGEDRQRAAAHPRLRALAHPRLLALAHPRLLTVLLAASAWGITVRLHPATVAAAACWLTICGVPLVGIDVQVRRLPDALTAASLTGVLGLLSAAAIGAASWIDLSATAAGGLAVGGFFGLLALTRPGSAGLGDAKLGLSTGALAGWFGWRVVLASVVAAFLLAAAYGLWLVATRRATFRGTRLPFGPFLLGGCLAVVLLTS